MRKYAALPRLLLGAAMAIAATAAAAAAVREVTPRDPRANPESLAMAPDGSLLLGSLSAPVIYRAKPGAAIAEVFIDLRSGGSAFVLGLLADPAARTLWVCEVMTMDRSTPILRPTSALRAFDLQSGAEKARHVLPDANNLCNDMAVAPDRSLYIADTVNSRILRLGEGAARFETVLQHPALFGVDGIAFLDGTLYVDTVWSNNLYRIPLDASGKAGAPIDIALSRPMRAPDGLRVANGRLIVAEGAGGNVNLLAIDGDRAVVTTLRSGLGFPTAVEPAGDLIWIADRSGNKAIAIPAPK